MFFVVYLRHLTSLTTKTRTDMEKVFISMLLALALSANSCA